LVASLSALAGPNLTTGAGCLDHAALAHWNEQLTQHLERLYAGQLEPSNNHDAGRLSEIIGDESKKVWAKPVRTFADLALRACLAVYWNSPSGSIDDPPYPVCVIEEGPECNCDAYATAMVVSGILDLAGGLRFNQDGQLLSPLPPSQSASPAASITGGALHE
jgi:hypothetical protein